MTNHDTRILIIGGGKMGEAILKGWISSQQQPAHSITAACVQVVNPTAARCDYLTAEYGVSCVQNVAQVTQLPTVVVLAVKPQVMMSVLDELRQQPLFAQATGQSGTCPLYISIAAGLATESLQQALPANVPLVRVMPNVALAIGQGASGVCGAASASAQQIQYVAQLFGCLGRAVVVNEDQMDAVCAVSGSGPAYVAAMVEAMRDAAVAEGLPAELAETLALQTVLGTASLISETDASVAETRESVCSPGGTTLAALDAMYNAGFNDVFAQGVHAAVVRSKELAQCTS